MKMKLKLNKKKMKSLSNDYKAIPAAMTPKVAGGFDTVPFTHDFAYTCSDFGAHHTCNGIP